MELSEMPTCKSACRTCLFFKISQDCRVRSLQLKNNNWTGNIDPADRKPTIHLTVSNIPTEVTHNELLSYFTEELGYPVKFVLYPTLAGEAVVILDCSFQDLQIESIIEAGAQLKDHQLLLCETPQVFHNVYITIDFHMHELLSEEFLHELKTETGVTITQSEYDDQLTILTTWPQAQMVYSKLAKLSKLKGTKEERVSGSGVKNRRPHSTSSLTKQGTSSVWSTGEHHASRSYRVRAEDTNKKSQSGSGTKSQPTKSVSRVSTARQSGVPRHSADRTGQRHPSHIQAFSRSMSLGEVPASSHIYKETGRDVAHPLGETPPLSISKVPLTPRGRSHSVGTSKDDIRVDPALPESPRLYRKKWFPDPEVSQWLTANRSSQSLPGSRSHKLSTEKTHHLSRARRTIDEEKESIRSVPMDFKYHGNTASLGISKDGPREQQGSETQPKSLIQSHDEEEGTESYSDYSVVSEIEQQRYKQPRHHIESATPVSILSDQFSSLQSTLTQRSDLEVTSIVSDQLSSHTDNTSESSEESTIHAMSTNEDVSPGDAAGERSFDRPSSVVERKRQPKFEEDSSYISPEYDQHIGYQRTEQNLPATSFPAEGAHSTRGKPAVSRRLAIPIDDHRDQEKLNEATNQDVNGNPSLELKDSGSKGKKEQNTFEKEAFQEVDSPPNLEATEPVMMERDLWEYVSFIYSDQLSRMKEKYDIKFVIDNVAEFLQFRVVPNHSSAHDAKGTHDAMEEISGLYQNCFSLCVKEEIKIPETIDKLQLKKVAEECRIHYPKVIMKESEGKLHIIGTRTEVFNVKHRVCDKFGIQTGGHRHRGHKTRQEETDTRVPAGNVMSKGNQGRINSQGFGATPAAQALEEAYQLAVKPMDQDRRATMPDREHYITDQGINILVYQGDITKVSVSVIVSAANQDLMNGSGVAGAISRAAGPGLENECSQFIEKNGSLPVGDVMHTSAGGILRCEHVIHTVGPIWDEYYQEDCEEELLMAYVRCFRYASKNLQAKSIAVPLISSGIFGMPLEISTRALMHAVDSYSRQYGIGGPLKEIHVVNLYSEATVAVQDMFFLYFNNIKEVSQSYESYPKEGSSVDPPIKYRTQNKDGQKMRSAKMSHSKYEIPDDEFDPSSQNLLSFHQESMHAGGGKPTRVTDPTECDYCQEEMEMKFTKQCGHQLCYDCYKTFSAYEGCPVCIRESKKK